MAATGAKKNGPAWAARQGARRRAADDRAKQRLFPDATDEQRRRLRLDDVAVYSTTDQRTADAITDHLLAKATPSNPTIVNATAGVGGNTWSFSKRFARVLAIERNPRRARYLSDNMRVLGATDNVEVVRADALHSLLVDRPWDTPVMDVAFFDPPWGGRRYKDLARVSLFLDGDRRRVPLAEAIDAIANVARYVAVKVPRNFDLAALLRDVKKVVEDEVFEFPNMRVVVLRSTSHPLAINK